MHTVMRLNKKWVAIHTAILLGGIAIARIISTYPIVSQTFDEPSHIAAGMELLSLGTYTYEQQHSPLARLAVAFGPYLAGARSHGDPDSFTEGNHILHSISSYSHMLTLARLGNIPFFRAAYCRNRHLGIPGVWSWRGRSCGA